jgi:membrane fusion protein (multidrug efflux system)
VQLGQRTAGTVEVLEGLEVGEQVVRAGMQRLRDGVQVRVLNAQADEAPPEPPGAGA